MRSELEKLEGILDLAAISASTFDQFLGTCFDHNRGLQTYPGALAKTVHKVRGYEWWCLLLMKIDED